MLYGEFFVFMAIRRLPGIFACRQSACHSLPPQDKRTGRISKKRKNWANPDCFFQSVP